MYKETTETLDQFADYLAMKDYSEGSRRGYFQDAVVFARWFEHTNDEGLLLQHVTLIDIREYRQYMLTVKRYKANTINRRLSSISAMLDSAKERGQIDHNPVQDVSGVEQVESGPKYLDKKEQYALQRAIEKDLQLAQMRYPKRWRTRRRDASLVIFLLNTGLRLNEALNLKQDDIQISKRKGSVRVFGKGNKQRIIPLNSEARNALQDWFAVIPEKTANGFVWIAVERVADGPLCSRVVQRVVRRLGQDAGLARLTPHILRHTFAKNLINRNVGLETIAKLLGHGNLETTKIYINPDDRDLEKAVQSLE